MEMIYSRRCRKRYARSTRSLSAPERGESFFGPTVSRTAAITLTFRLVVVARRDPRGISGNWHVLAERTLLMERDGDTKRTQIAVRIGQPYWREEGKWAACPLEIAGLYDNMGPMLGRDFYEALISALEFFDRYVRKTDPDTRYFWLDGTPYEGEPLYLEPHA